MENKVTVGLSIAMLMLVLTLCYTYLRQAELEDKNLRNSYKAGWLYGVNSILKADLTKFNQDLEFKKDSLEFEKLLK